MANPTKKKVCFKLLKRKGGDKTFWFRPNSGFVEPLGKVDVNGKSLVKFQKITGAVSPQTP